MAEIVEIVEVPAYNADLCRVVTSLVPKDWVKLFWPKCLPVGNRCYEIGCYGHPIQVPTLFRGYPYKTASYFYWTFCINTRVFLVGAFAALFYNFRHRHLYSDLNIRFGDFIYFDSTGMEIGGSFSDWMRWIKADRKKLLIILHRSILCGIHGGFLHSLNFYAYRTLAQAQGEMIPMLLTTFGLAVRRWELYYGYQTMGYLIYGACGYDVVRQCLFEAPTFFFWTYVTKYLLYPWHFVLWPPRVFDYFWFK